MKNALIERAAQLIAHRACCGAEHDPAAGKLHGCCVVCGVPWPCEYAGKPPSPAAKVADARYFEGGQDLSNDPIHVAAVDLQIALLAASEAAHRLTVIARDSEEALAAPVSAQTPAGEAAWNTTQEFITQLFRCAEAHGAGYLDDAQIPKLFRRAAVELRTAIAAPGGQDAQRKNTKARIARASELERPNEPASGTDDTTTGDRS